MATGKIPLDQIPLEGEAALTMVDLSNRYKVLQTVQDIVEKARSPPITVVPSFKEFRPLVSSGTLQRKGWDSPFADPSKKKIVKACKDPLSDVEQIVEVPMTSAEV